MTKKIICAGMAVAMMAALAIPAGAEDATGSTQATNTTVVKFDYESNTKDINGDNTSKTYTITIPATVDLKAGKMETTTTGDGDNKVTTNNGMSFTGDGAVKFSGFIGQDDSVKLFVQSSNGYTLTGVKDPVKYTMNASTTSDEIDLTTEKFSSTMKNTEGKDKVTIEGKEVAVATLNNELSITSDKGFVDGAEIKLDFANDGATGIFGKCTVQDTLTFNFSYGNYDTTTETTTYTAASATGTTNTFAHAPAKTAS